MQRASLFLPIFLLLPLGSCKKSPEAAVAIEGWHTEEGWMGSCFYPPDFSVLGSGDKRLMWQKTRDAIMSQWGGDRGDGVSFDDRVRTNAETAMLGTPDKVEGVAVDNLKYCQEAMASGNTIAWSNWFDGLPGRLTAGECPTPKFQHTLYDYLEIGNEWQISAAVCKEDNIRVSATKQDYYKISDDGPWINTEGDRDQPTSGDHPCNVEGCYAGQLIMRFTSESGVTTIHPVNSELVFRAPEHGRIEVQINDKTWFDNTWKIERGIEHHTGVTYKPAGD
jgi:hypothetical protein